MIRKTERFFIKRINRNTTRSYDTQHIKRTTYWLFFIFPIFIKDEVIKGDYER